MNMFFFSIAASNGELSTDGSSLKTETKHSAGDSDALDGYPSLSIPIEGDGVKIETGAECNVPADDNTGRIHSHGATIIQVGYTHMMRR